MLVVGGFAQFDRIWGPASQKLRSKILHSDMTLLILEYISRSHMTCGHAFQSCMSRIPWKFSRSAKACRVSERRRSTNSNRHFLLIRMSKRDMEAGEVKGEMKRKIYFPCLRFPELKA